LFTASTVTSPLEASSAELVPGHTAPALVVADLKVPSPLFAIVPGLLALYSTAPLALAFVLALLQAQWTYTGYDASAHVAGTTVGAGVGAGGVSSSAGPVSGVVGWVRLLVLTGCFPAGDVAKTAADPYPVLQIVYGNLPPVAGHAVAIVIGVAMWLC